VNIFVINLKNSTDRLDRIKTQLNALGLPFSIVEAIDGNEVYSNKSCINPFLFRLSQKRKCRRGEIGCAESHRKAWTEVVKHSDQYSLILEDDAFLPPDLAEFLETFEEKNDKLDIINLCSTGSYKINNERIQELKNSNDDNKACLKKISAGSWKVFNYQLLGENIICECNMMPHGMVAYIVTPEACKALLSATKKIAYPIDYAFRHISGRMRQGFSAPIIIPENPDNLSTIGNRTNKIKLTLFERMCAYCIKQRAIRRKFDLLMMYGLKGITK
jgi:GR25 family glycosyltransferase involved in LPS biosynthesis